MCTYMKSTNRGRGFDVYFRVVEDVIECVRVLNYERGYQSIKGCVGGM